MLKHYRTLLLILIHASPILIHASPILIHELGFWLSAPYLNILPTRLGNTREPSATNQNRVLRHPSRQPREPINFVSQSESSIT